MQLRVTRLCLDCEELFVGDRCPVCASDRYAFLTTWLPVEERRRWRRPAPKAARAGQGLVATVKGFLARWLDDDAVEPVDRRIRTRASDVLPKLDFDEAVKEPQPQPAHARKLVEGPSSATRQS